MGTCMHHMRGGRGSGEAYTRPEEQHSGEEEEATNCWFVEGGDLGVVEAGGEARGGVGVPGMGLTDRLSGSDRVWHKGRPGPVG